MPPLQDLATGYMSGKLLQKLDMVAYILTHHTSESFAFLDDPANARNRTAFYNILARLLFMDESPSKFKSFVAPLQQVSRRCCWEACAVTGPPCAEALHPHVHKRIAA